MNREQALAEIRANVSCLEYLEKSKKGNYCCPFCGSGTGKSQTGAVKYYPETNRFFCHSCNKSGDVIDAYQNRTGADFNTAFSLLAAEMGLQIDGAGAAQSHAKERGQNSMPKDTREPQNATEQDFTEYYRACRERLTEPAAVEYLKSRGISTKTAAAYWIGFDPAADPASAPGAGGEKKHPCPRLIIPTGKGHYVGRRIDGQKDFDKVNAKGSTPGIFNQKALYAQEVREVFVVEGAFDALSLLEIGKPAIALNSAGNFEALLKMLKEKPTAAALILCPDNDADPQTAEKIKGQFATLAEGLQGLNIPYLTADINGQYKDANEHLTGDKAAFIAAVEQAAHQIESKSDAGAGMLDAFLGKVQQRDFEPIPTGITDLDRALEGGFTRKTLVMLGAAPGMGKTALAQWIFENMASAGHDVLYINLEMAREQLLARSLSRLCWKYEKQDISALDVLRGYAWNDETRQAITRTAERYKADIAEHFIYNPAGVTNHINSILSAMQTTTARLTRQGKQAPIICIDYLQMIDSGERDAVEGLKNVIKRLKDFAIEHNTVVFVIMANNRTANKSGAADMESGRDTSAIEYSGDLMLGLVYTAIEDHREYESGTDKKGAPVYSVYDLDEIRRLKREAHEQGREVPAVCKELSVKVNKNRFGEDGRRANLIFDGKHSTFYLKEYVQNQQENPFASMFEGAAQI